TEVGDQQFLNEMVPNLLSREWASPSRSLPRVAIPREEPYQRFDARDHSIFRGEATECSEL
ncbi:hypothetical protein, partial [Methanoculleus sp. UBA389]|uniref:hypothetical protein n=1 Tax=Methanoculleus sp. UBA389 TaxID=1915507 RepID=UPI0031BB72C3